LPTARPQLKALRQGETLVILVRFDQTSKLPCNLIPNKLDRALVLTQTEKDWLAQSIIAGHFCKLNFANHRRFNPNAPLHVGDGKPWIQASTGCGIIRSIPEY
jgi:hypothetical protein